MDKFGVFKLLNSFFDYYKNNSNESSKPFYSETETQADASTTAENPLSPLLNNLIGGNQTKTAPTKKPISIPLQANMLGVMNSHDKFIERVKSKYSTNK